jgi:thiamine biosynthesis lipoprotein
VNRVAVPLELSRQGARPRGGRTVTLGGPTMGVAWTLKALAPAGVSDAALRGMVQAAVDRVVDQMSDWESESDLSRFNRAPAGAWIRLPDDLLEVLRVGLELAQASGGAFDPTMGRVTGLWGFGPAGAVDAPPSDEALAAVRAGWGEVRVDEGRMLQPGGLWLDFSGIAKGYGVDRAAAAVESLGVRDYLIEIGGELRGAGVKGDGEPWWVEVESPPGAGLAPLAVGLHGLSIATSGDWRRGFEAEGRRYSHTLDPRTRRPVPETLAAVTVLHADCVHADALCTALAVLGADAAEFALRHDIAARIVRRGAEGYEEHISPALEAMLA